MLYFIERIGTQMGPSKISDVRKSLIKWWPGTESNRRRQPFQGCALPTELPGQDWLIAATKPWMGPQKRSSRETRLIITSAGNSLKHATRDTRSIPRTSSSASIHSAYLSGLLA